MYPVAIMVVQHGNMFSSSWREIASQHGKSRKKEVVNLYRKYALVHMIATKSGMEGKCCAQTLLNYVMSKMEETYIFIANRPNPEFLLVDERNLENFVDDNVPLTKEEKMYFHIDDDYKQEMKYSRDQVKVILRATELIEEQQETERDRRKKRRKNGRLPTANSVAPRYQTGNGEKRISDLMNLYEMNHYCAQDDKMTCDYDNSHMFGYESHMHQRQNIIQG